MRPRDEGGITSGVVYPLAIAELAEAFRFRSIGGTSAGAIAAAAAAAAELGRQRHAAKELKADPRGFEELARLPDFLGMASSDGRGTKLMAFFRPGKALRGVFHALLLVLGAEGAAGRILQLLLAPVRAQPLPFLAGLALGLLAFVGWTPVPWVVLTWATVFGLILGLGAATVGSVMLVVRELPRDRFGFCSGMGAEQDKHPEEAPPWWPADLPHLSSLACLCSHRMHSCRFLAGDSPALQFLKDLAAAACQALYMEAPMATPHSRAAPRRRPAFVQEQ